MKIYPSNPEIDAIARKKAASGDTDQAEAAHRSFSEILNTVSSRAEAGSVNASTGAGLQHASSLGPVQQEALALGASTLDILDWYQDLLTRPNLGEAALDSVANALSERTQGLKAARDSLDSLDPLRETLDAIGTLAAVETAKIRRGDYSS